MYWRGLLIEKIPRRIIYSQAKTRITSSKKKIKTHEPDFIFPQKLMYR